MSIATIFKTVTKLSGRGGLLLKAKSPEIMLTLGLISGVGATVLAVKATLKVDSVMDEHQEKLDRVKYGWSRVEKGELSKEVYSEQDYKKDLSTTYIQTGVGFAKLYWPSVTLGALSIGLIIGSFGILKQRNVALMAAYKLVEEGFAKYRRNVVEEFGEEKDFMLKNGLKSEQYEEEVTDEKGKKQIVQKSRVVRDPNGLSIYARFFDESCSEHTKDPAYNKAFLMAQQQYWNTMLQTRGHVFLNEVYDRLGIDRTDAGAIVGWVLEDGDGFIDFGMFDGNRQKAREFINGKEYSILLDFNVDGVIYDRFTKRKA
jgi:hypothetical protein